MYLYNEASNIKNMYRRLLALPQNSGISKQNCDQFCNQVDQFQKELSCYIDEDRDLVFEKTNVNGNNQKIDDVKRITVMYAYVLAALRKAAVGNE